MDRFKFIHAADLHLDSPLRGLSSKSADFAAKVERASRQAFDNLIDLAITEGAAFMVLAGDIFDGDLRNYQAGLHFTAAMRRLEDAGVRVFMVAGNHDAENRYAGKLKFSANVHLFDARAAESVAFESLNVVVHGRSFGQRDVTENIALTYPAPVSNRFNIGVLHTACAGSEGTHAVYAPCTPAQLINHGYDYWALGHVHARAVLNEHPHIVYPGNLQGRHPREPGDKGATVVEVVDGKVLSCEHRSLDVIRWAQVTVDLSGAINRDDLLQRVSNAFQASMSEAGERAMAVRLRLAGSTALHGELMRDEATIRDDVEAFLASRTTEVWLEKLEIHSAPISVGDAIDPTIGGQMQSEIRAMGDNVGELLEDVLAEIQVRMPAGARCDELFAQLRESAPERAVQLALALVSNGDAPRAD